jgi:hypothetical protein
MTKSYDNPFWENEQLAGRKKRREREKNAIYSGHLRLCHQPRAAHALRSDQFSELGTALCGSTTDGTEEHHTTNIGTYSLLGCCFLIKVNLGGKWLSMEECINMFASIKIPTKNTP